MIYTFRPIFKTTIWGGDRIAAFKGIAAAADSIGESWEISGVEGNVSVVDGGPDDGLTLRELIGRDGARLLGEANYSRFGTEFPLLVKFIDARADLSIQVHPDDALAAARHGSRGKTEMWYVVDATPDAHLMSGLRRPLTPDTYVEAVERGTITDCLTDYRVAAGDVFFLPAGRIHSIGAGCFIAEIQQTSDITYRIYDFGRTDAAGRPRELHTALAKDAIDYTVLPDYRTPRARPDAGGTAPLVACPYFTVDLAVARRGEVLALPAADSFVIVMAIGGDIGLAADACRTTLRRGQTALIAADARSRSFRALDDSATALVAYIE